MAPPRKGYDPGWYWVLEHEHSKDPIAVQWGSMWGCFFHGGRTLTPAVVICKIDPPTAEVIEQAYEAEKSTWEAEEG